MNTKESIEKIKRQITIGECEKNIGIPVYISDLKAVLEELEEYEKALDIFDEREYRKKYLEEERAIRPKLLYPDADEIYQKYFQQRAELEKKDKVINEMAGEIDKLSGEMQRYDEDRTILECCKQNQMCETNGDIDCANCIIEYFTNKVEREGK